MVKKGTVHIDNIEIGFVGLLQNQSTNVKLLRKIMFAKILDEDHIGLNSSNEGVKYELITPTGPKEVGKDDFKKGVDLCEKISGKQIIYPVTNPKEVATDTADGDIIILPTIEVGTFLRYLGFPLHLDRKNLKIAKEILLNPNFPIKRQRTPVEFESFEYDSLKHFDPDRFNKFKEIIEQVESLKMNGNSTRVSPKERIYLKSKRYTASIKK